MAAFHILSNKIAEATSAIKSTTSTTSRHVAIKIHRKTVSCVLGAVPSTFCICSEPPTVAMSEQVQLTLTNGSSWLESPKEGDTKHLTLNVYRG